MKRKLFDVLASAIGLAMVVVLVVAGGLLMWGYSFANSNVHNQLAQQGITFPSQAAFAQAKVGTEIEPVMIPYIAKYAGQPLTTGQQAEAYADHFIAYHLQEIGGGQTYAQLSSAALALPKGSPAYTAAEAKAQTVFQGTTLRGLLLEAYAFWMFGQIAVDRRDRHVRPGLLDGPAGRPRVLARPQDQGHRRVAGAHGAGGQGAGRGVSPSASCARRTTGCPACLSAVGHLAVRAWTGPGFEVVVCVWHGPVACTPGGSGRGAFAAEQRMVQEGAPRDWTSSPCRRLRSETSSMALTDRSSDRRRSAARATCRQCPRMSSAASATTCKAVAVSLTALSWPNSAAR